MAPDQRQRFEELLGAHLDGALDAAQTDELAAILTVDAEARRLFARSLAMDTALPRVVRRRQPTLLLWSACAAAAALVIGLGAWLLRDQGGPTLEPGSRAVVVRAGRELTAAAAGHLRPADRIRAGDHPAVILWGDEATRATLAAGGSLDIVAPGPAKDLRLGEGQVDVAADVQVGDRRLTVRTDRLSVAVVGTRFRVANSAGASSVAVEHGSVAVDAGGGIQTVGAGQVAIFSSGGPAWISPPGQDAAPLLAAGPGARLDAAAWRADGGTGWRGALRDDGIAAVVDSATAERVQNPNRPMGYARFLPDLTISADISLGRPGTVAIYLICRQADGRDWLGNYQVKVDLPAGRHRRTWSMAEIGLESGAPVAEAQGARLVSVAVCAWHQPVGLVVHAVRVGR